MKERDDCKQKLLVVLDFEFGECCLYSHPKATQENLNQEHAFFNPPMISISGDLLLRRPGPAPWGALWWEGGVRQQVAIILMIITIRNVYGFSFSLKEFESNPRDLQSNSEGSARCSTLYLGLWTFSLVSYLSCFFVRQNNKVFCYLQFRLLTWVFLPHRTAAPNYRPLYLHTNHRPTRTGHLLTSSILHQRCTQIQKANSQWTHI